jgi:Flp pilus assembly pilin Flp
MRLVQFVARFHREESGQDMLEYALVLLAVLAAVVAGSNTLSGTIGTTLNTIDGDITTVVSTIPGS